MHILTCSPDCKCFWGCDLLSRYRARTPPPPPTHTHTHKRLMHTTHTVIFTCTHSQTKWAILHYYNTSQTTIMKRYFFSSLSFLSRSHSFPNFWQKWLTELEMTICFPMTSVPRLAPSLPSPKNHYKKEHSSQLYPNKHIHWWVESSTDYCTCKGSKLNLHNYLPVTSH